MEIPSAEDLTKDSRLSFVHRFTAGSEESAKEIASHLVNQLNGIMRKVWSAAWVIGNEKRKMSFGVSILQLMRACNPDRESNFGTSEIDEFYQTLKSMEPAQFILERTIGTRKKRGRIVDETIKYNISLLKVSAEKGEINKTPDSIFINLFDVTPLPTKAERTGLVGMPVKRKTLEMNAKDVSLAMWLQTKINQIRGGGKKEKDIKFHDFQRSALIEAANLQNTDAANPRVANARLLKKLNECKKAGILLKIPTKIGDVVQLRWT